MIPCIGSVYSRCTVSCFVLMRSANSAWELCQDVGDSPAEAIAGAPFKAVALPDLVKVTIALLYIFHVTDSAFR